MNDGKSTYWEIYLESTEDENNFLNKGFTVPSKNLHIFPREALDDSANIVHLKLTNLPFYKRNEVLDGLQLSLKPFGQLLDCGIYTVPNTNVFVGTGYAVLDITPPKTPDSQTYALLNHFISWIETNDYFHATWQNMPTWCRYCHSMRHTKFECEKSKARIICYACHEYGHRSMSCPRANLPSMPSFKKPRKKPNTSSTIPPAPKRTSTTDISDDDSDDSEFVPSDFDNEDASMRSRSSNSEHSASSRRILTLLDEYLQNVSTSYPLTDLDRQELDKILHSTNQRTPEEIYVAINEYCGI